MKQHIYLIGFMGTGKTTISHKLRELTGAKEIDMDAWIVEKNALSINEMFEKYGETYFRDRETDAVCEIAKSAPAIVSCGGGAVLREENVSFMKEMAESFCYLLHRKLFMRESATARTARF